MKDSPIFGKSFYESIVTRWVASMTERSFSGFVQKSKGEELILALADGAVWF
jgi:hypothetical protein